MISILFGEPETHPAKIAFVSGVPVQEQDLGFRV